MGLYDDVCDVLHSLDGVSFELAQTGESMAKGVNQPVPVPRAIVTTVPDTLLHDASVKLD